MRREVAASLGNQSRVCAVRLAPQLEAPSVAYDLPAGGRRLTQKAHGYVATIVGGVVTYRDGHPTGALPGRLVRGSQAAPMALAAE